MIRPPPSSTLFPFTTLFRSSGAHALGVVADRDRRDRLRRPVVDDDDLVLAADRDPALVAHRATSAGSRSAARTRSSSSDRKSTRLNSSHPSISYAVFCLKKK